MVSTALRIVLVASALGASLLSVGLFMAGTSDNNVPSVTRLWLLYVACGLVIGSCLPRWWYAAIAVAWLPLLLLPGTILTTVSGTLFQQPVVNVYAALMFLFSPAIALAAGYGGGKLTAWCQTMIGSQQ